MDIKYLAVSNNNKSVVFIDLENYTNYYDLESKKVISKYPTVYSDGGKRLFISDDGKITIAGAWERHGVCAYETISGKLLWKRKDLKKSHIIKGLQSDSNHAFITFEKLPSRIIDIKSGEDIDVLKGVSNLYQSRFKALDLIDRSTSINLVSRNDKRIIHRIKRLSFSTLDATFSKDTILISESGKPLRCFKLDSGNLLWVGDEDVGSHYLQVKYNEDLNCFIGIKYNTRERTDNKIHLIDVSTGEIVKEVISPRSSIDRIINGGRQIVTGSLEVIKLKD